MSECSSLALYERLSINKDYHNCCIKNAPPVVADIFKNSLLQQEYRGFEINQQIV